MIGNQNEVGTHEEGDCLIVRSAVHSALKKYVWNRGMCGGTASLGAREGGAMFLSSGCFVVRPRGKRRQITSSSTDLRESRHADNTPTLDGPSITSVGAQKKTIGSELRDIGPTHDALGAIINDGRQIGRRGNGVQGKGCVDKSEFLAGIMGGIHNTSKVGVARSSSNGHDGDNILHDETNPETTPGFSEAGHTVTSDEFSISETDDNIRSRGRSGDNYGTRVLDDLLLQMTRVAESLSGSSAQTDLPGAGKGSAVTAVILLDSPLIPPEYTASYSQDPRVSVLEGQQSLVGGKENVGRDSGHQRSTQGQLGSSIPSSDSARYPLCDRDDQKHDNVTEALPLQDHPAGLGDPRVALRALRSWAHEGQAKGLGRRNIVIVCGQGDRGDIETDVDRVGEMQSSLQDDSVCGEGTDRKRSDETGEEDGTPVKNCDWGKGGIPGETIACRGRETSEEDNDDDIVIWQITLGPVVYAPPPKPGTRDSHEDPPSPTSSQILERRSRNGQQSVSFVPPPRALRYPSEVLLRMEVGPSRRNEMLVSFPRQRPTAASSISLDVTPHHTRLRSDAQIHPKTSAHADTSDCIIVTGIERHVPRVLVGPVIGGVTSTSAAVLLELEYADTRNLEGRASRSNVVEGVVVVLVDTFSSRRQETTARAASGVCGTGPRIFEFHNLVPGRRYMVSLKGVRPRDQVLNRIRAHSWAKA